MEQHQFYVPNLNFAREEHPLRVQTRGLFQNIWLDLRYSSGHFEAICGLHPHDFVRPLRAADFLHVHFYGKEAARLLGRGREQLNWNHFAGMSYFSVDNVCYTHFKNVDDFLESLRQGRQVSNFKASYVAPNFKDDFGEPSVRLWFCTTLNLLLMLLSRSTGQPLRLTGELQPFSVDMLNFCFCPRSAVWLPNFGLQLLLETAPAEAARILQAGIGLLSFRIPSREVLHFIENSHFRCWIRQRSQQGLRGATSLHDFAGAHPTSWKLPAVLRLRMVENFAWSQPLHAHPDAPLRLRVLREHFGGRSLASWLCNF